MSVLRHIFHCMGGQNHLYEQQHYSHGTHCLIHRKVKFGVPLANAFPSCDLSLQSPHRYRVASQRLIYTSIGTQSQNKNHPPASSLPHHEQQQQHQHQQQSSLQKQQITIKDDLKPDKNDHHLQQQQQQLKQNPLKHQLISESCGLFVALPLPMWELLIHLAHAGMQCSDLFRRPGNINHMKWIMTSMARGHCVAWSDYNVYTLANVVKRFLLDMPGGLFGVRGEIELLELVDGRGQLEDEWRIQVFIRLLDRLPLAGWQLVVLIFGMWFRMIIVACADRVIPTGLKATDDDLDEVSVNDLLVTDRPTAMAGDSQTTTTTTTTTGSSSMGLLPSMAPEKYIICAEGVAKSVCGSVFHTCRDSPSRVHLASQVLQLLILSFPRLGSDAVEFFHAATDTRVPLPTLDVLSPQKRASLMRRASRFALGALTTGVTRRRSQKHSRPPPAPDVTMRPPPAGNDFSRVNLIRSLPPPDNQGHRSISRSVSIASAMGRGRDDRFVGSNNNNNNIIPLSSSPSVPPQSTTTIMQKMTSISPYMNSPPGSPVIPQVIITPASAPASVNVTNKGYLMSTSRTPPATTFRHHTDSDILVRQSVPVSSCDMYSHDPPTNDRYSTMQRRRTELLRKRSEWFLSTNERPSIISTGISNASFASHEFECCYHDNPNGIGVGRAMVPCEHCCDVELASLYDKQAQVLYFRRHSPLSKSTDERSRQIKRVRSDRAAYVETKILPPTSSCSPPRLIATSGPDLVNLPVTLTNYND